MQSNAAAFADELTRMNCVLGGEPFWRVLHA
jgi:hypothetical protein